MTTGELSSLARGRQENKPFMWVSIYFKKKNKKYVDY
jgi:hypothetical protein